MFIIKCVVFSLIAVLIFNTLSDRNKPTPRKESKEVYALEEAHQLVGERQKELENLVGQEVEDTLLFYLSGQNFGWEIDIYDCSIMGVSKDKKYLGIIGGEILQTPIDDGELKVNSVYDTKINIKDIKDYNIEIDEDDDTTGTLLIRDKNNISSVIISSICAEDIQKFFKKYGIGEK